MGKRSGRAAYPAKSGGRARRAPWPDCCSRRTCRCSARTSPGRNASRCCQRCSPLVLRRHARLVAVERDRLAVAFHVRTRRLEVAEGRLGRCEMQRHQPARRIVDDTPAACRPAPVPRTTVIAAIDLDQLAQTRAPRTRLVDLRRTLPARHPQAASVISAAPSPLPAGCRGIRAASRTPVSARNPRSDHG